MTDRALRIVKHHHACVELVADGGRILLDPGSLGPAPDLDGVDAVLVTHEHPDHADPAVLSAALDRGIPMYGPASVRDTLGDAFDDPGAPGWRTLSPGDRVDVVGLDVVVGGGPHAEMHPDVPGPENLSYLVAGTVLVSGDRHTPWDGQVPVLVTPVDAPWLRAVDLIRYVRQVAPRTVVGVHDGLLNDTGLSIADRVLASLEREGVTRAVRPAVGEELTVP
ncbi:MBL fold metallo-hydrolase [Isoptericola sediminis]|uniref:MBL fold metallo-hydrolase n=1 Tax=Isoptericola sediminis TaxID=2733572 RepID=A0A849K1M2_9MICO|nr:MBL fold metallo-hydrolase [Isoptericola sediminis]NNU26601.1 MBL fold metallo-hydrolase [Isoptericola sediminis]